MGQDLRCDLENRMQEVQSSLSPASGRSRPRVLLAVGRSLRSGAVGEVYVSGRDGFYNDLINLAGGENAYREETLKFPALSAEGLALLDPDVIVEMIPDLSPGDDPALLMSYWRNLPALKAVQERRVHILVGDHVVIPGPRFILLLEEMREVISRIHETGSRRQEDSPGSTFNVQHSKFKVQGITSVQK
jgi:iron complex transport system substrate-binding protein